MFARIPKISQSCRRPLLFFIYRREHSEVSSIAMACFTSSKCGMKLRSRFFSHSLAQAIPTKISMISGVVEAQMDSVDFRINSSVRELIRSFVLRSPFSVFSLQNADGSRDQSFKVSALRFFARESG